MPIDFTATADRYVEFWNTDSPERQRELAPSVFTDDIEYHALPGMLSGSDALIDFRAEFTAHVGAASFEPRREPEGHHDRVRLLWSIRLSDGDEFAAGTDVLSLEDDGRISSVSTFLDRAPRDFHHG